MTTHLTTQFVPKQPKLDKQQKSIIKDLRSRKILKKWISRKQVNGGAK